MGYTNESLNLWGYADRREDALRDLHESFDYIYREIAEEADVSLDDVAKKLKENGPCSGRIRLCSRAAAR